MLKKNYIKTNDSRHWLKKYPNEMKDVIEVEMEQYFVSPSIYIKRRERTHCLSMVTNAFSRKVIRCHLSDDMSAENVAMAIKMAANNRITSKKT